MSVSSHPHPPGEYIDARNESVTDSAIFPNDARAGIQYETDGDTTALRNAGNINLTDWLNPKTAAPGDYQIRATLNSGSLEATLSNSTGVWLALTSTRRWQCQVTGTGIQTADLTIDFRLGTGAILKSVNVDLEATVEV